ncbi:hypothetical protein [Nonlabens agnitus]|uniref:Uncharacterized protein n=1 Tax=Nonlabens agnitus TaxID=870484 RepID=A0A2S9WXI9_9FLAO|nr:hypothetical protein [Nonlabens agnitus]PRP68175.1 hypothetical protein BST86_14280 [Nonlabens agnitus]
MIKLLLKSTLFIVAFLFVQVTHADQLAYIRLDQAKAAKEYLETQSHVIVWCACCENEDQQYLTIENIYYKNVNYKNLYQVVLQGKDIEGNLETVNLDLAYTHVPKDGYYHTVGKLLNYDCDPCTQPFKIDSLNGLYVNPTYGNRSSNSIHILDIFVSSDFIMMHILYKSPIEYENGGWSRINSDVYIKNSEGKAKYSLLKAEGIAIAPNITESDFAGQHRSFRLYFPRIPDLSKSIDMIECVEDECFNFFNISLAKKFN